MMVKLAQFSLPGAEPDLMVHSARYRFLNVLDEECPEAREELVGAVRTVYREMFDVVEPHAADAPIARKASDQPDLYENKAFMDWLARTGSDFENAVDPFSLALKSWIERFNLRSVWLIDAGIRTIMALEAGHDWEDRLPWEISNWKMLRELTTASELEFQFSHPFKFGPSVLTYEAMKKEVRKEFKKAVDDWFQNLGVIMKQHGYKENPVWDDPSRDIRWLVRFQCVREEYDEIAEGQEEDTPDKVRKAVGKTAKRLDITLRKARLGRRSKKKLT